MQVDTRVVREIIRTFSQLSRKDVILAGGKGASLGDMTQAGFSVPPGFVVLTTAFEIFLKESGTASQINKELSFLLKAQELDEAKATSQRLRTLILNTTIPISIEEAARSLGDDLVGGRVAPISYTVYKDGFRIDKRLLDKDSFEKAPLKLTDNELLELAKVVIKLEDHFNFPVDVEWIRVNNVLRIVQCRPITGFVEKKSA